MIKAMVLALSLFALSACSTTARYSPSDQSSQGVKVGLGAKDGIQVGDHLRAFIRNCEPDRSSRSCRTTTIGTLTVTEVHGESYSLAKVDNNFELNDSVFFEKDSRCTARPLTKQDPGC